MSPSKNWLNQIKGEVRHDELLSKHTSLRVGGPADLFIIPRDRKDLQTLFKHRGDTPLFILGEGTNLIMSDQGFRGIVISIQDQFKSIEPPVFFKNAKGEEGAVVTVGAAAKMSYLVKYLAKYSLTGMENLVGIPGSLGGALIMNAGADGTEIGEVVRSVTRVNAQGDLEILKKDDLKFEYRKTTFPTEGGIIVEAELELKKGEHAKIQEIIDSHLSRRRNKQPLTMPNSGSVFKNPEGDAAGRLIEEAGLKGYSVGDAGVSIKHANFIVNKGAARASEVIEVIEHVKATVKQKTGIELETEVIIVGER
ncbi:MAG: UDP-N-acetylmuramate dehydrogenase [Nitrospinaceae bacterium]|nr:UDP-N-acetylmuramate dehydrogenase [Nitrospinaceae bacterium]NIR57670.1 UDP-N-acetylmuramate dehydrogenase [Nitrospinaceae bacterium]NIS88145.1 UDP-N-acetylmuramate dehydrogenase [Nitrospinaceae bacterium]NIT85012.1 UDP-N-acetylmuramate dehydrogenase [Nitrospinaceae bacterium]NIU47181.1 UDP-N-acetylmuramate dehydrogenase [Nitrospinaceae bacterium]